MLRKKITTVVALVMAFDLTLISGCGASAPADTGSGTEAQADTQVVADQPESSGTDDGSNDGTVTEPAASDSESTDKSDDNAADNTSADTGFTDAGSQHIRAQHADIPVGTASALIILITGRPPPVVPSGNIVPIGSVILILDAAGLFFGSDDR